MHPELFLHAGHQVRQAFDGLEFVSWAVAGLALGALVLGWGRVITWLRSPDASGPALVRWGHDDDGYYFELRNAGDAVWSLETDSTLVPLDATPGRSVLLRATNPSTAAPVALCSSTGHRLPL